jgi:hypothetical protein
MSDLQLTLCPTVIGGDRLKDDFSVYFEGRRIGRIKDASDRLAIHLTGTGISIRRCRFRPGATERKTIWSEQRPPSGRPGSVSTRR